MLLNPCLQTDSLFQTIAEETSDTQKPLARIVMKHDTEPLTHIELTLHIDKVGNNSKVSNVVCLVFGVVPVRAHHGLFR